MKDVLDLDALLPEPKTVVIGGVEYKISASLSVKDTLEILKNRDEMLDAEVDEAAFQAVLAQAHKLFQDHQPNLTVDELAEMLTPAQLNAIIEYAFEVGEEQEVDPTEAEKSESPEAEGSGESSQT